MAISIAVYGQEMTQHPSADSLKSSDFELYPNPAFEDVVYITTRANSGKDIMVYDIFGKVVLRDRISGSILNISKLTAGVYFLQVTERGNTMSRKLVVK